MISIDISLHHSGSYSPRPTQMAESAAAADAEAGRAAASAGK